MILQVLLFAILAIGIGLAFTFFGYGLFRILFPIWGFFVGLWLGGTLIAGLLGGGFLATSLGIVAGLFVGLLFAALAYFVYAFAIVLFGASAGFAIGEGLVLLLGIDQGLLSWTTGLILAVVFALVFMALRMPEVVIMAVTAFAGASAIIAGILALFGQIPPEQLGLAMAQETIDTSWFWWTVWFSLALFGVFVQSALSRAATLAQQYSYEEVMMMQANVRD